jgi:hypothetical protein
MGRICSNDVLFSVFAVTSYRSEFAQAGSPRSDSLLRYKRAELITEGARFARGKFRGQILAPRPLEHEAQLHQEDPSEGKTKAHMRKTLV